MTIGKTIRRRNGMWWPWCRRDQREAIDIFHEWRSLNFSSSVVILFHCHVWFHRRIRVLWYLNIIIYNFYRISLSFVALTSDSTSCKHHFTPQTVIVIQANPKHKSMIFVKVFLKIVIVVKILFGTNRNWGYVIDTAVDILSISYRYV